MGNNLRVFYTPESKVEKGTYLNLGEDEEAEASFLGELKRLSVVLVHGLPINDSQAHA